MTDPPTDDTTPDKPRTFLDVLDELAHETGTQPVHASIGLDLGINVAVGTDQDLRAWATHLHAVLRPNPDLDPPELAFNVTLPNGIYLYVQSIQNRRARLAETLAPGLVASVSRAPVKAGRHDSTAA